MTKIEANDKITYSLDALEALADLVCTCKQDELADETLAYVGLMMGDYVDDAREALAMAEAV